MAQKTPMAFQDQRWKAGTEGYRNWRWINLLPCELPPPFLCWDRPVRLDALVKNWERGFGVTGYGISIWFSQVSFVLEYLWLLTSAIRIEGSGAERCLYGHCRTLPCRNMGAHPGLVEVVGEGVSGRGGSSTRGAMTCLLDVCTPFGTGSRYLIWAYLCQKPPTPPLCVFRHMN